MGRFKIDDLEHYGGQGGGGFFSLRDDKATKQIRFMYNGIEDIEGTAVHQVEVDGKKRYVSCLRSYDEPIDKCPLCAAHYPQFAKFFVPVYDIEEDKVKWWERGKQFGAKLSSLCSRYAANDNLVQTIFEVERNGKKGDTNTTYEIYKLSTDDTQLEDLEEVPKVVGTLVLDKTAAEMEYYLEQGEFPEEEKEVSRRSSAREETGAVRRVPNRRTPGDRNTF